MRQELTNASHRCENLGGSMENLTQEEVQEESNVNQLAEKVDDKFKESTAEVHIYKPLWFYIPQKNLCDCVTVWCLPVHILFHLGIQ